MAKYEKTKKDKHYLFINTMPGVGEGTEIWARVGKSTEWTDTMNPKTTTYEYIEDSGPTDVIESYQPSASMPLTAHLNDPIYDYVFDLYSRQEVSGNAVTKAMRVYQKTNDEGKNIAQVSECTITIDNYNFNTGVITFSIKQGGTPKLGTAAVAESTDASGNKIFTPTFTADEA